MTRDAIQTGLVSVILPVFNVEKYLDHCVASIVNQTYTNLEILLIDDGSPDCCPQICDDWAAKDSRIRVIHKRNEGLGMARNTGIENAKGEYICFFDSDDYIVPEAIEKAYRCITETKAELVSFGFFDVNEKGTIISMLVPSMERSVYSAEQVQRRFLPELIGPDPHGDGTRRLYMSACMMLFSMDVIQRSGWRFVSERVIISEDVYSLLELFSYVKSVAVLSEALYFYRCNMSSTSRSYRERRYGEIRHFYLESMKLCDRLGYCDEVKKRMADPYLAFTRAAMKQEMAAPIPVTDRIRHIRDILQDETLQRVLHDLGADRTNMARRLLFFFMKHQMTGLCCLLLAGKNAADRWRR